MQEKKNKYKPTADHNIFVDLAVLRRLKFRTQGFSFSSLQPVNSALSGKNTSKLRGRGLNFEELRHYRPGDDIRAMDWKVTQRTGKPHVKVFTEEKERNIYLAIDQRMTMFFGSSKMKSVIAAELAALMAWRIIESGDRVGAIIYNDNDVKFIPAKRGQNHVLSLLTAIKKINHQLSLDIPMHDNSVSFNKMLNKVNAVCGNNALIMLIGDGHGWDENSSELIKKLRQHNEVIAYQVKDKLETKLPEMAQMVVSDGKWQIQFSSKNPKTQQKYQALINDELKTYSQAAKRYRIPFIEINTSDPIELQVKKALGGL